jgi:hypothetical protein
MEEEVIPELTFGEKLVGWAMNPISLILYAGILSMGLLVFIRRGNKIDIDLESDVFTEDSSDDESDTIDDERDVQNTDESVIKRTPPSKEQLVDSGPRSSKDVPKKRKAAKTRELNKDGPITKTKRKRLVSNIEKRSVVSKSADDDTNKNVVKKRKVKSKQETPETKTITKRKTVKKEIVEEVKISSKKRKSVKRKKKTEETKVLDEDKLQEKLASDFLTDE